jgi:hypothetical protein
LLGKSIFANDVLNVQDADVIISLNAKQTVLKKNQTLNLSDCDTVTFVKGKGKVKINHLVFSESTITKTYSANCDSLSLTQFFSKYVSTSEKTRMGVTVRGVESDNNNIFDIELPKDDTSILKKEFLVTKNYILIKSERFSSTDIVLEIKDKNNETINIQPLLEEFKGTYKIDTSLLEHGGLIILKNTSTNQILLKISVKEAISDLPDFSL